MSSETMEYLNGGNILAGFQDVKPVWWSDPEIIAFALAKGLLDRSPLYSGAIPWDDAYNLLDFQIVAHRCAAMLEVPAGEAQLFYADGTPYEFAPVEYEGKRVIGRDDGRAFYYVGSDGFNVTDHQYADWLLASVQILCGDGTGVELASVGLLGDGATCFSSILVPEWVDTAAGFKVMPYFNMSTGMDGMTASAAYPGGFCQVCDNTTRASRGQAEDSGRIVKVKHTRNSGLSIASARETLGVLETTANELVADINALASFDVSDAEWQSVLDALVPVPDEPGRGQTMATNRRDVLWDYWRSDPRVSPWKNTALGVQQAFSTYAQHDSIVRGTNRVARNLESEMNGKFADVDELTIDTLLAVTNRELQYA